MNFSEENPQHLPQGMKIIPLEFSAAERLMLNVIDTISFFQSLPKEEKQKLGSMLDNTANIIQQHTPACSHAYRAIAHWIMED